jgi:hypothetical protein
MSAIKLVRLAFVACAACRARHPPAALHVVEIATVRGKSADEEKVLHIYHL